MRKIKFFEEVGKNKMIKELILTNANILTGGLVRVLDFTLHDERRPHLPYRHAAGALGRCRYLRRICSGGFVTHGCARSSCPASCKSVASSP